MDAPRLPLEPIKKAKSTSQRAERDDDPSRAPGHPFEDLIRQHVVHRLGSPTDLYAVDVRPLWANHFRVNVFVGKHSTSTRVANSFFLVADGDGNILSSSPQIARLY